MSLHTVALPVERFRQLQNLAQVDGKSIADTIGDLINSAIHDGRLAPEMPGWMIERRADLVVIAHPERGFDRKLDRLSAHEFAERLERVANGTGGAYLDLDNMIQADRRGSGVRLLDVANKITIATSPSVAEDLAHLIRKAATR